METEKKFEYEVAFSFLQQDEALAYAIRDLISDSYSTFIYSEHQKKLAGNDGEEIFNSVFGEKARIVVVLYREEWGKTKWTRIEETAIKNRGFEETYDFTIFVQIDQNSKMPKWLPKNRIYYNFDRWGIEGLAPVIESKIQEWGGQSAAETLESQAEKITRVLLRKQERLNYLNSNEAYREAQLEFNKLYELLDEKTKALEDPTKQLNFGYDKRTPLRKFIVRCENYSAHFSWSYGYTNSLSNSGLQVSLTFYDSTNRDMYIQRQIHGSGAGEKAIAKQEYHFDVNILTSEKGWTKKDKPDEFYSSEKIMNVWLKLFLEKVNKAKLDQFRNG